MNSKQRVHAALRRQPADRVPIFMWFHPRDAGHAGPAARGPAGTASTIVLGNDVRMTWVNNNYAMEGIVHEQRRRGARRSLGHPLGQGGAVQPDRPASRWPRLARRGAHYRFPLQHVGGAAGADGPAGGQADEYFIGCDVSPCVFEMYWRLRGHGAGDAGHGGRAGAGRRDVRPLRRFRRRCWPRPPAGDFRWTGCGPATTWPASDSLMMSPATWRRLIKPHLQRVFDVAKPHRLGSCITAAGPAADHPRPGRDGPRRAQPHPVQLPRHGPAGAEAGVRRQAGLHGRGRHPGAAAYGSADEVRRATRQLIDGMTADGGGYILAAPTRFRRRPRRQHLRHVCGGRAEPRRDLRPGRRNPRHKYRR